MVDQIDGILAGARRLAVQIPEDPLDDMLSGRPRSYRQLAYHVFNIVEVFLDWVERDTPYTYEALLSILPHGMVKDHIKAHTNKGHLARHGVGRGRWYSLV